MDAIYYFLFLTLSLGLATFIYLYVNVQKHLIKKESELEVAKSHSRSLEQELSYREETLSTYSEQLASHRAVERERIKSYEERISNLNRAFGEFQDEKLKILEEKEQQTKRKNEQMLNQWREHEADVCEKISQVSMRFFVEIVQQFPHKGKPDNVLSIKNEFVIFDAKSPGNIERLHHLDTYLKEEAKKACKYTNNTDVRNEVFFVIPDNTLSEVKTFFYQFSSHKVFIIPISALDIIVLNLKQLESYEFANNLSPEQRDQITSFIANSVYMMKRRIQIDNSYAAEVLEFIRKKDELPDEFQSDVENIENALVFNPPMDKRGKKIDTQELLKNIKKAG